MPLYIQYIPSLWQNNALPLQIISRNLPLMNNETTAEWVPFSADSEQQLLQFCSCVCACVWIRLSMMSHSFRLQWYIIFPGTQPWGNQTSHSEHPGSHSSSPSGRTQPCLCSNDTTALPSACAAAAAAAAAADTQEQSHTSALQRTASHWQALSQNPLAKFVHLSAVYYRSGMSQHEPLSIHSHLSVGVLSVKCLVTAGTPHLSLPTACQSCWSEPAPPPPRPSRAGPAGRTQSARGRDSGRHRLDMTNANRLACYRRSAHLGNSI